MLIVHSSSIICKLPLPEDTSGRLSVRDIKRSLILTNSPRFSEGRIAKTLRIICMTDTFSLLCVHNYTRANLWKLQSVQSLGKSVAWVQWQVFICSYAFFLLTLGNLIGCKSQGE